MAHDLTMSSKVSRIFQKWPCFGRKAVREEVEENSLRRNQPKIIITECKSVESTPNVSRKSRSSSSSSNSSSTPHNEVEAEIKIRTDGKVHEMGMKLVLKTRDCDGDEVDGGVKEEVASMITVKDVKLGSFAHGFGIREGDMVFKINGKRCIRGEEIKDAFLNKNSDQLEMEILRKKQNRETVATEYSQQELIKMTISNARRIGGQTENELEIITVEMGSSWSLSDNGLYFHQDPVDVVDLQFATFDTPWVVRDGRKLALKYHLSIAEEQHARFFIHKYWSMSNDTGIPVVIQHAQSRLCVALENESIYLEEVSDLDKIEGQKPYMFIMHTEQVEGSGMNMTFKSVLDTSCYIGFHAHEDRTHAEPIHVVPTTADPLGNEHEKLVFILTYL